MAGVAVLHPQDVFINQRHRLISAAAKSRRRFTNTRTNPTPNNNNTTTPPNNNNNNLRSSPPPRRKRSPTKKDPFPSKEVNNRNPATAKPRPTSNPTAAAATGAIDNKLMGHVKILKRGETLSSPATVGASDAVPARISPAEPDFSPKRATFSYCYAGSACDSSPPPSSLPVPAFFKKKNIVLGDDRSDLPSPSTKDATNDLLKLLRLDLS